MYMLLGYTIYETVLVFYKKNIVSLNNVTINVLTLFGQKYRYIGQVKLIC